jgi:hypothetical protein
LRNPKIIPLATDEKTTAKLIDGASRFVKALNMIFKVKGKPSRKMLNALGQPALSMVRYQVGQMLAADQNDEFLNAPIPNKGPDYVEVYRDEKLKALLQKYKIAASSPNSYYQLALALATDFHPGFKAVPFPRHRRPRWSGVAGLLLVFSIEKIRAHSKTQRSTTALVRELKRQFPKLYGRYSEQTLKVRYFEVVRAAQSARGGYLRQARGGGGSKRGEKASGSRNNQ